MNRWKVITGILLIFVLGALSGALGTGYYTKSRIKQFIDPKGPPPPIRILERELGKLDLSSEQQRKIEALLEQMHTEFFEIIKKTKPEMDEHFKRHVQRLKAELRPKQQRAFDKTIRRIEDRMKPMNPPPFRPRPPKAALPRLKAELDLTPEQTQKSELVIVSMEKKRREIFRRFEAARALLLNKMKSDMAKLMDETEAELETFLSAEQAEGLRKAYVIKRYDPPGVP
jgi:transcription initiation factor TFIIIB Brf1 subunit/transcription initiation factor TFIIB